MHVPANIRLNRFTTRAITPVVLLGGLLLLAVYHFRGVLAVTQTQNSAFQGLTTMSSGPPSWTTAWRCGPLSPASMRSSSRPADPFAVRCSASVPGREVWALVMATSL